MEKAGLYFHIPFCKSKCPYCDFYSVKYDEELAIRYTDEIIQIMKQKELYLSVSSSKMMIPLNLLMNLLNWQKLPELKQLEELSSQENMPILQHI